MKIPKIKFKKFLEFIKKLPKFLTKNTFLTLLGFLFISLILGAVIFYQYSFLTKTSAEIGETPLEFKEKTYQTILNEWQKRNERFSGADLKEYLNPFQEIQEEFVEPAPGSVIEAEEEEEEEEKKIFEYSPEKIKELQAVTNLFNFYHIKGEGLPSIAERGKIWEEKGLGAASEYHGFEFQNIKLLEEFKKELTQ